VLTVASLFSQPASLLQMRVLVLVVLLATVVVAVANEVSEADLAKMKSTTQECSLFCGLCLLRAIPAVRVGLCHG
jgi:hypothetical protein